jgi:putative holliday junction resolvase
LKSSKLTEQRLSNSYVLGLDVGEARIGLAVASSIAKIPRPYKILINASDVFSELNKVISEENIDKVVVGLPRNMSGEETAQTKMIRDFADKLQPQITVPILFADETLSSNRAKEIQKDLKDRPANAPIDDLAACFILEEFFKDQL